MTDQENTTEQPVSFTAEQMKAANDEAKGWRLKLRDAEKQVEELTTQLAAATEKAEQLTTANSDLTAQLDGIAKEQELRAIVAEVAEKAGVPVDALRGSTREELEAHAAVLQPVFRKANGPFVPTIGDVPSKNINENEQFVRELFGSD